ncbi:MAG TPA: manganese efflux pump MntP family protein [Dehalococcoidia bacterium]|nr:manganese efflux pump MntP family protein [Dehalococcoidia bacterium]
MDQLSLLLVALGLSADCFAVSMGAGAVQQGKYYIKLLRIAFTFGLFQFLMLVAGWFAGRFFVEIIQSFDHWLAFILLCIVGGRMIWEFARDEKEDRAESDISRGWLLISLAIATSIDALAVGLSFAFLQISIVGAGVTVGVVTFIVSAAGFWLGKKISMVFGRYAKLVGGIVLIIIGVKILIEHLFL